MTQVDTSLTQGVGVGNIELTPPADKIVVEKRGRKWFFTWNNYESTDIINLTQYFEKYSLKYMFQEEMGEKGTRHLQGFFILKNGTKNTALYKRFPSVYIRPLKSEEDAKMYCSKEETRNGKQWSKGYIVLEDPLAEGIKAWQQDVLDEIKGKPDSRKITWICDKAGNSGKTSLAKHICMHNKNAIYVSGKASDIKFAVCKMIEDGKIPEIMIFDYPRSAMGYISYPALEELKNGIFFSGKYESGMVMFNSPHVICFANEEPEYEQLSEDRWNVIRLDIDIVEVVDRIVDDEVEHEYELEIDDRMAGSEDFGDWWENDELVSKSE